MQIGKTIITMMAVATMEMAVAHHPTITGMAIVEPFVVVWVITILIQMVTAMLKMALMLRGITMPMVILLIVVALVMMETTTVMKVITTIKVDNVDMKDVIL
jgi:hypothetical protein